MAHISVSWLKHDLSTARSHEFLKVNLDFLQNLEGIPDSIGCIEVTPEVSDFRRLRRRYRLSINRREAEQLIAKAAAEMSDSEFLGMVERLTASRRKAIDARSRWWRDQQVLPQGSRKPGKNVRDRDSPTS